MFPSNLSKKMIIFQSQHYFSTPSYRKSDAGASLFLQPLIFAMLNQGIERSGVLAVKDAVNDMSADDVLNLSATEVVSG